jgi:hypothetical protein
MMPKLSDKKIDFFFFFVKRNVVFQVPTQVNQE